jgi:hypothetical protein
MFRWFRTPAEPTANSQRNAVYDFLYCDSRRVASFLSQFHPSGYLTAQRRISSDKTNFGSSASLGGGLVGSSLSGKWSTEVGRQSEETYDPFWTSAISLLDHLEAGNLLKNDMHDAAIGQLLLVAGDFRLVDLRVVKAILSSPVLGEKFGVGNMAKMTPDQVAESALTLEFVKVMPHTVQAEIRCQAEGDKKFSAAWMTLNPAAMVVPPDDILMKYGHKVPGRWKMLAIKDASIDDGAIVDAGLVQLLATKNFSQAAEERHTTSLALMAEFCAPLARKAMGRPGLFYGVTPIMIFRDVGS